MAKIIRRTKTLCPECARELDGAVIQEGQSVYLRRECPEHGTYRFLLSNNGDAYADYDRFFFEVLQGGKRMGRIANIWILASAECQVKCKYCSADMHHPAFEDMSMDDLNRIMDEHGRMKLTLAGGEPTLHTHCLDFFREAARRGIATQLATNGVRLASKEFCRELAGAGVTEVRMSLDSLDRDQAARLGSEEFYEAKLSAIDNLQEVHMATSLSPTIFKGVNEDQLAACVEFSKNRPHIRSISANGFSWIGGGRAMERDNMTMPDEMMDLLFKRHFDGDREDCFTFQKAILAVMQLADIRLCLYTQLMVFVRSRADVTPITHFLNMKRLKKGMKWWEKCARSGRLAQVVALGLVLAFSARLRSIRLAPAVLRMLLANLLRIDVGRYPSKLLTVVLNTNCSLLNADESVAVRCMSNYLLRSQGKVELGVSTKSLLERERQEVGFHAEKSV